MSKWRGLAGTVARMERYVHDEIRRDGMPTSKTELLRSAARVGAAAFGDGRAVDVVNLAMLALLTRCAPTTWLVRPSASRVVHETDLHSIPLEPPQAMLDHGVVEARRPETGERLWDDVVSLGWYSIEGTWWLVGLTYPDGYRVVRWSPRWTGEDLADELPAPGADPGALVAPSARALYDRFAHEATRYLVTFALLAEADPSPLRIVLDRRETRERKRRVVDVFFDGDAGACPDRREREPTLDRTRGLLGEDRPIKGHLKRQRFGEGRERVKWIYVHGFQSRRWLSSRWLVSAVGSGEID